MKPRKGMEGMKDWRKISKNRKKEEDERRKKKQGMVLNETEEEGKKLLDIKRIYMAQWRKGKKNNDKRRGEVQFLGQNSSSDSLDPFPRRNNVEVQV